MGNALSQRQVDFYRENGFCVVDGIFDAGLIEKARAVVDGLLASADLTGVAEAEPEDGSKARRIWAPTSRDELFAGIAEDTRLLDAVGQLIGPDIVLQYSKLNNEQVEKVQQLADKFNTELKAYKAKSAG